MTQVHLDRRVARPSAGLPEQQVKAWCEAVPAAVEKMLGDPKTLKAVLELSAAARSRWPRLKRGELATVALLLAAWEFVTKLPADEGRAA
jgi:hypothetical protein